MFAKTNKAHGELTQPHSNYANELLLWGQAMKSSQKMTTRLSAKMTVAPNHVNGYVDNIKAYTKLTVTKHLTALLNNPQILGFVVRIPNFSIR